MASQRAYSTSDLEFLEVLAQAEARENFWAFRQYLDPTMVRGWWQREVAAHLQQFWADFCDGKRPKLLLMAPPQHGKSRQVIEFISWVSGKNPDLKTIYSSFSDDLGVDANRQLQRIYDEDRFMATFPRLRIGGHNVVTITGKPLRNSSVIEYANHRGSFRNTTVLGQITGKGLDLGVVDDPIKGREAANSKPTRDKTWSWFTDDFLSRFADHAAFLMMLTRWHVDDPAGRLLEEFGSSEEGGSVRILRYPAIAEEDEQHRSKGKPLFPELKSLEFLNERRQIYTSASWESLYQQNPIVVGGGLFPVDRFVIDQRPPLRQEVKRSIRYWDKAGTQDGGAYTCGVLMHNMVDGTFVISDVQRGQWSALDREKRIKNTADIDSSSWDRITIWVEQEPGSGGKESAERSIAMLAGHKVKADRVTGDKVTRAEPYAAQVEGGNVHLVGGLWSREFMEEHENFPYGKFKDQVDAAAGAFAKLTQPTATTGSRSLIGHY